jgi:hypothetical protein
MTDEPDLRFGALAVKNGFASESEVELALEAQKDAAPPPKIGEILVEMGTLSEEKVNALLAEQACLRNGVSDEVPAVPEDAPAAAAPAPPAAPAPAPPAAETAPQEPGAFKKLAARYWEKFKRLCRDVSGKRAKEKAAAFERRDQLLTEIAEACLSAGAGGPEAESAAKARKALDSAKKEEPAKGGEVKGVLAAKGALKSAEAKLKRALLKLGRTAVDKGSAPESQKAKADEIRALDEKIKDLT